MNDTVADCRVTCPACNGEGAFTWDDPHPERTIEHAACCDTCHGEGELDDVQVARLKLPALVELLEDGAIGVDLFARIVVDQTRAGDDPIEVHGAAWLRVPADLRAHVEAAADAAYDAQFPAAVAAE